MTPDPSAWEHLRFLVGTLGPRPAGSAGAVRAAEYIRNHFAAYGLELEKIAFPVIDWLHGSTCLTLDGEGLAAKANPYSPACDVRAELVPLRTLAELEQAEVTGKVLLFYANLTAEPLIPLNCQVYNAERDQRINQILNEQHPAAVITVNPNPPAVDARFEDADLRVPSATVSAAVGLRLLEAAGQPVRLAIEAESLPSQAVTWVGRKAGPDARKLVIMAHYDTKHDTPGAVDNGTGIAALLELVSRLAPRGLPVGLEFIAFGDEEYYAYSDGMYIERHGAQLDDIVAAINMDAMGQRLGTNTLALMGASDALQALVSEQARPFPALQPVEPWPQSNHSTFAYRGVPAVVFGGQGITNLHHQPQDTLAMTDPAAVAEVVTLVESLAAALAGRSPAWTRPAE